MRRRDSATEQVQSFSDDRGRLTLVEAAQVPFTVRRTYVLHEMPAGTRRGGHANRTQHRLLVILAGGVTVRLDDGTGERQLSLRSGETLLVEPAVWHELEISGPDTAVLVFADGDYDPGDYIEDRTALAPAASTRSQTTST
jgi:dTDP-4-dehydrorhamnose 3,5-epimerase-like enzyme